MELPNPSLIKFHSEVCPDIPIDSQQCFYRLIEELNKIKQGNKEV